MDLKECCRFLEDLELIPVTILDTDDSIQQFCEQYYLHSAQKSLQFDNLKKLLSELTPFEILTLQDHFQIHFLFARMEYRNLCHFVAYGPFCTELLSSDDAGILLQHLDIQDLSRNDLQEYRARFQVQSQGKAQYAFNILLSRFTTVQTLRSIRALDESFIPELTDSDPETYKKLHGSIIRKRYEGEQQLISYIAAGNSAAAINTWHELHRKMEFRKLGHTLEISRSSAAVTRTLIRFGAIQAGIPAELNDDISGRSAIYISRARTIDMINEEHERLIQEYCHLIHRYKTRHYCSIVLSALYMMEHDYAENLTSSSIAGEIGCSVSTLLHRFKQEVHITPGVYLNQVRMKKAAYDLSYTDDSIQEISNRVGILDANYFVKCFRRVYKLTPSQYRKIHRQ